MSISSIGNRLEETFLSSRKRIVSSIFTVMLLLSIPITLSLVYQQQDIRQRAADPPITCMLDNSEAVSCPDGYTCVAENPDLDGGAIAQDGVCVKTEEVCASDNAPDDVCACTTNSQCPLGLACVGGKCTTSTTENKTCESCLASGNPYLCTAKTGQGDADTITYCSAVELTSEGDSCELCVAASTTPTTPVSPNDALLTLKLLLPGIGGTSPGNNQSPNNPEKTFSVAVFNNQNNQIKSATQNLEFGKGQETLGGKGYGGKINLGTISNGNYITKVKTYNSLWKQIPGTVQLNQATSSAQFELALTTGDLNQDNKMGIEDYNIFLVCYAENSSCGDDQKVISDLNSDGKIDTKDLNILLRAFANRQGD